MRCPTSWCATIRISTGLRTKSTRQRARVSTAASVPFGAEVQLTVTLTPARSGWNYASAVVSGLSRYTISRIVRGDGTDVPLRNAWITDRTFRDAATPLLEERLHIVDAFTSNQAQAYTVYLSAKPTEVPEVVAFEGLADGSIAYGLCDAVTVRFSKPIDPASFTVADITLLKQGVRIDDLSALSIVQTDDTGLRFTIENLSTLCDGFGHYELAVQCAGISDLVGALGATGKSLAWTYAREDAPCVVGIDGVSGRPTQTLDEVTVTFSAAIDPATFTTAALRLNGATLGDGVTITALDDIGTRFAVRGLSAVQNGDGAYTLALDATTLSGVSGGTGMGVRTVTWTRDTVAPALTSLTRTTGLNGNTFTLAFSERVASDSVSLAGFTLKRLNANLALPATAQLTENADGIYVLSGIDSVLCEDGAYELSFSAEGVTDMAGNAAAGVKSVSWSTDSVAPAQIADLAISPDAGFSSTDGITCTNVLVVTGTLPEAGLSVEILARTVGGDEVVLAVLDADAPDASGAFAQTVVLPDVGNVSLMVRLTDAAGNSSDTVKDVYVDALALTAELSEEGTERDDAPLASAVLAFGDAVMTEDVVVGKFTLTRNGAPVALEDAVLSSTDDRTFVLSGLDAVTAEDGVYVLTFDGAAVRKRSSGLVLGRSVVLRWTYASPDRTPPEVTAVLFDGEVPNAAYTNGHQMFSSVSVMFSEAVNVPDLAARGLLGRAVRIDLLDASGVVTGCLAVARRMDDASGYHWDAKSNTLSWTIDPMAVPVGKARLMVDAGLVADVSGNRLSAVGFASAPGLRTYASDKAVLARVNAQAMPAWYGSALYVGEKTADGTGKIRRYDSGNGDTWTYLQSDGVDIEIPSEGCQGASVAFADMDGDDVDEIYVGTSGGDILKYPGGTVVASLGVGRAMPFTYDADGDGCDELLVGGIDGRIRLVSRDAETGAYAVARVSTADGAPWVVPNGRAAPVAADINHDGYVDLLSGDTAGNVWGYLGEGTTWCATPICLFTNDTSRADRSRLGYGGVDMNDDGVEDVFVGRSDGSVTVLLGAETPSPVVSFTVEGITLAQALNADGLVWTTGGAAGWQPEWSEDANDGLHHAHSGEIGNDTNSWIETTITGAGVLSFAWKSSTEARYDMLQVIVDGEVKGAVSGETPWTTNALVLPIGTHTIRWNYRKSRNSTAGADRVWLDAVTWTLEVPPTLAEALNADLFWTTDGDVAWTAVRKDTVLAPRDDWATVGGLADYEVARVETAVYGAGILTFDWAVSCEEGYDWFDFIVDGEIRESITGETGWKTVTVELPGEGRHILQWEYWKDDLDEDDLVGDNRARLDNVRWTPVSVESQYTTTTPDPIPFADIRTFYRDYWFAAGGDYEVAAHSMGRNGFAIWWSYVAGLDPDDTNSKFMAKIELRPDGTPKVTWEPDTPELRATRTYTIYGKRTLLDRRWTPITDDTKTPYNFFKVTVEMK